MTTEVPKDYMLDRNSLESARLSYQHQCMIARQGYYLHPTILAALDSSRDTSKPLRVLDLATGNGIWAIELASSLASSDRSVEILGLDVSSAHFPPKQTWPNNVTFEIWDLFTDVREQDLGSFDVVHIRFIISLLWQDHQRRERALQQFYRLLKPGGYLQWQEGAPPVYDIVTGCNSEGSCEVSEEWDQHFQLVDDHLPMLKSTIFLNQLDELVRRYDGFVDVVAYWPKYKKERLRYETDLCIWTIGSTLPTLLRIPGLSEPTRVEIRQSWEKLQKELESGSKLVGMKVLIVVSRKQ